MRSTRSWKSRCTRCWVRGTDGGCAFRNATASPSGGRQDPGFGGQRGGLAIQRLGLAKVGDVPGCSPLIGIDATVDVDGKGWSGEYGQQQHAGHGARSWLFHKCFGTGRTRQPLKRFKASNRRVLAPYTWRRLSDLDTYLAEVTLRLVVLERGGDLLQAKAAIDHWLQAVHFRSRGSCLPDPFLLPTEMPLTRICAENSAGMSSSPAKPDSTPINAMCPPNRHARHRLRERRGSTDFDDVVDAAAIGERFRLLTPILASPCS